jgi:phage terminase large subunit-like protein
LTRVTMKLHRVQAEYRRSNALYRAFIGGRGSGKSFVACYDLIRRARRGRTYLVAAPTYPMLFDSEFRTFTKLARELGVLGETRTSPPHVRLTTGADILFRSADDPERLRGPNLSGAVLMEGALMKRDAFDIVIACLREGGEQGWLTLATTPRGPNHWTHEVFATGKPDTELFRATTGANPFNPPNFEATLKRQYGETQFARQELGGEFVAMEGAAFPPDWFDWDGFYFDDWPSPHVARALYLDPAKGEAKDRARGDYQAFAFGVLATVGGENCFYLDADMNRNEDSPAMIRRGVSHCRAFRPDLWEIEDNGTMGFLEPVVKDAFERAGLVCPWVPVTHTENKHVRVMRLAGYLQQRMIRIRDTPGGRMLRAQLGDYPLGDHDDGPDAAAGVVRLLETLSGWYD